MGYAGRSNVLKVRVFVSKPSESGASLLSLWSPGSLGWFSDG